MGSGGRREGHPGTKHHPIVRGGAAKIFLRTLAHSPPPRSARVVALAVARAADTDRVRSAPRGRCCRSFVCGSPAASYFGRGTEGRVSLIPRPPGVHLPRRTHARCPARRASRARSHLRAATVPLRASKFSSSFLCGFSKPCSVWGFSHPLFPRSQAHFGAWRGRARWRTATATASGAAPAAAEAANATAAAVKDSTRKRRAFHEVTASPAPRRHQDNTENAGTRALIAPATHLRSCPRAWASWPPSGVSGRWAGGSA